MKKLNKIFKSVISIIIAVIIAITISFMTDNFPKITAYILLVLFLLAIWSFLKLREEYSDIKPLESDEYVFRAKEEYILFDSADYDIFLEKCVAPLWGKDFIVIDKDGYQLSTDYCDYCHYPITVYRLISKPTTEPENSK